MLSDQSTGFTWVSLLIVLSVLGSLLVAGVPHWQRARWMQEQRILFHDMTRALLFARNEAFLRGENLVLLPLDENSNNWHLGMKLQREHQPAEAIIYQWSWPFSKSITLTWHGFRAQNKLLVSAKPDSLAMNGYFLLKHLTAYLSGGLSVVWDAFENLKHDRSSLFFILIEKND